MSTYRAAKAGVDLIFHGTGMDEQALDLALADFAGRQRRHGRTGDQVENKSC
jgi:trimethylamine:corrinoid methyltransferase-like protein